MGCLASTDRGAIRWSYLDKADTFAASERIFRDPARRIRYEREMSAVRVQLGEKAFAAEWQAGQTMTPAQAIDAVFASWD